MLDTIIKGGTIVDGSGAQPYTADIGIVDGKIAAIGRVTDAAKELIDADGLTVTPGWVDIHTHYDAQAVWDPVLEQSSKHGVTTTIFGNCGVGFAPVRAEERDWVMAMMEHVEDIPREALAAGLSWEWESFPEYLDALERRSFTMDVGAHMAYGPLRVYVMGERGARNEPATADDIARLSELVSEAQDAGAFGLSINRAPAHKAADGQPVPGTYAQMDELEAVASAVARSGHGAVEFAPAATPEELGRMYELATRSDCPVTFTLVELSHKPDMWRKQLDACAKANAAGARMYGQAFARGAGLISSLNCVHHPFAASPVWRAMSDMPVAERVARLRNDETLRKTLALQGMHNLVGEADRVSAWDQTFALTGILDYEPAPAQSIAAIAERRNVDAREVVLDLMLQNEGEFFLLTNALNYAHGDLNSCREMLLSQHTIAGGSDAGAHVGQICDASSPTFMLSHWARGRTRGATLPIEHVVKKQTADTAVFYGLKDRGIVRQGLRADINVIDFDNLKLLDPHIQRDLPGGALRLMQGSQGYVATLVNGVLTQQHDELTGALPGQLIRSKAR